MRTLKRLAVAVVLGSFTGCAFVKPVSLDARVNGDAARLERVKRVAIMPFFNANALGSDDPDPAYKGKYADMIPSTIVYKGVKDSSRFDFIGMDAVVSALKKNGFEGVKLKEGEDVSLMKAMFQPDRYRTGFTMAQALKTGRELKADALLIGGLGMVGNAPANMRYVMSLRLVDPANGAVLWGSAKAEPLQTSILHPIDSYTRQIQTMAGLLLAEAR